MSKRKNEGSDLSDVDNDFIQSQKMIKIAIEDDVKVVLSDVSKMILI